MKRLVLVLVTGLLLTGAILISARETPPTSIFQVPQQGQNNPWTHLRANNAPEVFQFAIVTDRTGGHRALVFEKAVRKLNLMQPEFVLSVGDLIEGGSQSVKQIEAEWSEFQGLVKQLTMPFFYVPGNHDISNDVMAGTWKSKFGQMYYHFVYKDCLFLCMNCEVGGVKTGKLDDAQVAYFRKVLAENAQVRWTFLFVHRPLWVYGPDQLGTGTGWSELEESLKGRKFTAFCGHHHRYQHWQRNGNRYLQLATTGGASQMRGKFVGEFDQFAWVTMTANGPVITNLLLDGVMDVDVAADLDFDLQMNEAQRIQKLERERAKQERLRKEKAAKEKAAAQPAKSQ